MGIKISAERNFFKTIGSYPQGENILHRVQDEPSKPKELEDGCFKERSTSYLVDGWIEIHDPSLRGPLSEVVNRVEHISFEIFLSALEDSVKNAQFQLSREYKRKFTANDDAVVMVEGEKSNKWVAELALQNMHFCPAFYFRLGDKDANNFFSLCGEAGDDITELQGILKDRTVVLFDDGSYSGKQLKGHVLTIAEMSSTYNLAIRIICLIVPFMTRHARAEIKQAIDPKKHPQLIIAKHKSVSTLQDLSDGTRQAVMKAWYLNQKPEASAIGLTWFDHKIPNSQSFPKPLVNGSVYDPDGFASKKIFSGDILPKISPPYR